MIKLTNILQEMVVNQPGSIFDPASPNSSERLLRFIENNKIKILKHLSEKEDLAEEASIEDFNNVTVDKNNTFSNEYGVEPEFLLSYPGGASYALIPDNIDASDCRGIYISNIPSEVYDEVFGSGANSEPLNLPGIKNLSYEFIWC